MYYDATEIELEIFADFPADGAPDVCPTGAISWGPEDRAPSVTGNDCIGCGLCLNRCPVRAISLNDQFQAMVHDDDTSHFKEIQSEVEQEDVTKVTKAFAGCPEEGYPVVESDELLSHIADSLPGVPHPNLIVRNLLIQFGWKSAMRRRGDVNIRIDIVAEGSDARSCVIEVQPSPLAILEAPRDTLDDIAVLVGRYGQDRTSLTPVVVTHQLPNRRSEYWQIVDDIQEVLGIAIQTVTTPALLILAWARAEVDFDATRFDVNSKNHSLKEAIEAVLSRPLNLNGDSNGIIEPQK